MTTNCLNDNMWGDMDLSQCTFRNDAPVAAVAVVELLSMDPENSFVNVDVRMEPLPCSIIITMQKCPYVWYT